ncbi:MULTISPECIES: diguanylate cyclase domain-containing protein [unclassified Pseudomonas]|uniref:GGDEF domain-containing protein n=1 Tax=unclassified Pseudomonas TaxID=196821 RepID=UPI000BCFC747|nr:MULTISPECIES: diguanylate cyclase [unclassified Pseudomonas]PVZ20685.1 diguanylate cyclase (GGDEF)-like protein [Pseudomonas sp. URIL14HWK12:I12]PVZ27751.1 diguanylate cyclase (GGDEF)-like protein [Pseudomonas sp. URIL14HWK12:I10]PVZ38640.1 diguanylate cyclase (GGDEF)-like protein [Pseudomonas sp. URIL14HWK12:I11]SNZ02552.1 diguanylate cyclase (GGDEF) domain-containing protein [Pseudomonas sp. URIL14HWK12:I9]
MERSPTLLIVDDDVSCIRTLSKALAGLGQIIFATNGQAAVSLALQRQPDVILLDAEMPTMSGFEVCQALKADPLLRETPIIFITSHTESTTEEAGLALGAVDFIGKPIRPSIVAARVKTHLRLKLAIDQLNLQAQTDSLTGLRNRRALDERIEHEWQSVLRHQRPFSLLLLDIDFFKRYNDHYGHLAGDECLTAVAKALDTCIERTTDLVARYGGEEFAVILPETAADGARLLAKKIVDSIRSLNLPHAASDLGWVTVSVGAASFDSHSAGWDLLGKPSRHPGFKLSVSDLLGVADKALYAAKHAGRNCSYFETIDGQVPTLDD